MPKNPGPSNPEPICPLCSQAGTDYTTSVLVSKAWQNLGHAMVNVHVECLLRAGGTFWQLDRMPQLQENSTFLASIRQWDLNTCYDQLTADHALFVSAFPALITEIENLIALLKAAGVDLQNTRSVWYGYFRPVDCLAELRQKWDDLLAEKPHLAYSQGSLFDPPC
jgi:hypothetical protein